MNTMRRVLGHPERLFAKSGWLHQGSILDLGIPWTKMAHMLMCFWWVVMCFDVFWCVLMWIDVFWCVLMWFYVFWLFWSILMCLMRFKFFDCVWLMRLICLIVCCVWYFDVFYVFDVFDVLGAINRWPIITHYIFYGAPIMCLMCLTSLMCLMSLVLLMCFDEFDLTWEVLFSWQTSKISECEVFRSQTMQQCDWRLWSIWNVCTCSSLRFLIFSSLMVRREWESERVREWESERVR